MSRELTRRSFITTAGVLGGTAALATLGCSSTKASAADTATTTSEALPEGTHVYGTWRVAPKPIKDDQLAGVIDCDIVVCGAGLAGLPAAAYAAEQGAKVHVLEKGGRYGQHRLCTCGFNAECQKRFGLSFDRKSVVMEAWKVSNGYQGMIEHYGRWFDNSADYVNWLESIFNQGGWQLVSQAIMGADGIVASLKNIWWPGFPAMVLLVDPNGKHLMNGGNPDWTKYLYEYAIQKGATFHLNTPGVQLVKDSSGRVTSVIARDELGDYYKYNASKGILLSTGDVAGDPEMMRDLNPSLERVVSSICEKKETGDGHKMGIWIGAAMDDTIAGDMFPFTSPVPPVEINRLGVRPLDNPAFAAVQNIGWRPAVANLPVLMVDGAGHRLAAEDLPFQAYSIPSVSTYDGKVWSVWDSAWEKKFPTGFSRGDIMCINTQQQLDLEVEKGITHKFDTIDELIEGVGFDKDVFTQTLKRYHELCAAGEDLDCYKKPEWLTTIDVPPFYAAVHGAALDSTRGGLKCDGRQRVLDTEGRPMPGLYVAGNTAGSFYGNVYPPNIMGSGIGHGQCFGWLAIKDMLGIEYK